MATSKIKDLVDARKTLHQAIQLISAAARCYSNEAVDDHHASLFWKKGGLETKFINSDKKLKLDFTKFAIFFLEIGDNQLFKLDLAGSTENQATDKMREVLNGLGFDKSKFSLDLPYEIPEYPKDSKFQLFKEEFEELSDYFKLAHSLLTSVGEDMGGSEILCWPHHFDIATLITLSNSGDPETSSSIGVGMSPGDEHYEEPYFYVSPWPYPDKSNLPELSSGHWHTQNFFSAVLTRSEILTFEERSYQCKMFLQEAIGISRDLIV